MANSEPKLVSIEELIGKHFFIPAYQRGYRWESTQIEELLNDIKEFSDNKDSNSSEFYCLQPIVVRAIDNGRYEVLDGQQRLTTIFLILKSIAQWESRVDEFTLKQTPYTVEYETRSGSSCFLEKSSEEMAEQAEKYIDYFYISQAQDTISAWFKKFDKRALERRAYNLDFLFNTKVIWYQVAYNDDVVETFTRLNMGKIRLTNAELVKALLLSQSTNSINDSEAMRLKQLGIASEWDLIEKQLNDIDFWSFITNKSKEDYPTKIELLLELSSNIAHSKDKFNVFNHYATKSNNSSICDMWEGLVADFEILKEWYSDREKYHLIGYLIFRSKNLNVSELISRFKSNTKTKFISEVKRDIKELVGAVDIEELNYKETPESIHNILNLFNILSVMRNKESLMRFPFAKHKNSGVWSLEHIHAQNSQGLNDAKAWREWLEDHYEVLISIEDARGKELARRVEKLLEKIDDDKVTNRKQQFDELFDDVLKLFEESGNGEDVHGIENMALLGKIENSSLNNSVFAVKRRKILALDKLGSYIPICTRNVFLKYYNPNAKEFFYWGQEDRDCYLAQIKEVLKEYITNSTPKK